MKKEKEIEMLISKYRADIAGLEEREVDLEREIEIMENLIPNVVVSYLGKSFLPMKENPNPEHETETDISRKVEHLTNVLQELQVGIELIREEKQIMKKRIEELETSLADKTINFDPSFVKLVPNPSKQGMEDKKHDKVLECKKFEESGSQKAKIEKLAKPDKIIDAHPSFIKPVPSPSEHGVEDKKHDKVSESLRPLESGQAIPANLAQIENTDWKSAYEDLKNKIAVLTKHLDDTSNKLMESKGYLEKLEEKYYNLKKEFQTHIDMLERMNSKSISEIGNKKQKPFVNENKNNRFNDSAQSPFNDINDPSGVESKHTIQSGTPVAYEPEQHSIKNDNIIILEISLEGSNKLGNKNPEEETGDLRTERSENSHSVSKHGKSAIFNKKLEGASKDQLQMPRPEKPNSLNATSKEDVSDPQNKPLEPHELVMFDLEGLLFEEGKDTDWKKVYENLQDQISYLTNMLNDSTQKLMESKEYVKNLEDKYFRLKKEMQGQVKELELKTDSFTSDFINSEPGKGFPAKRSKGNAIPSTHDIFMLESRPTKKTNSRIRCIASGCTLTHLNEQHPHFDHTPIVNPKESSKLINHEKGVGHNIDEIKDQHELSKGLLSKESSKLINHDKITGHNIDGTKDQHELPKRLLVLGKTDWKKVCEDLQKKVIDLTEHQNNSLQKLEDSENYIKNLQDEYSNLVKELCEKIKFLEKKTDSLISAIFSKEQEKYLKEELESKGTISAIQEALAEVRSMKESLSKKTLSRTKSKGTISAIQQALTEVRPMKESLSKKTLSRTEIVDSL